MKINQVTLGRALRGSEDLLSAQISMERRNYDETNKMESLTLVVKSVFISFALRCSNGSAGCSGKRLSNS